MKRTSWILLILLIIVLGAYALVTYLPKEETPEVQDNQITNSFLIQEAEGTLVTLRIINTTDNVLALQKNSESIWEFLFPVDGVADQAKLSAAETQINAFSIVTRIGIVAALEDFGLQVPLAVIKLEYSTGVSHLITIGSSSPTGSGYYVQLDGKDVFVVSEYSLDTILDMADNPPFPATSTPLATLVIPSPTPTLEGATPTQATLETTP